ncbi:hypothetical protein A9Q99_12950 [Gammaproteobacteria bacterium 45_16_T64]|nr:hypothetical protein A9Q99_12950 [Gammaproteobacteria bacterium 45_16_T64]
MLGETETQYRSCGLCEKMCGLEIESKDSKIVSVVGDKADIFSKGRICPKAFVFQDITEGNECIRQPLRRTVSGWVEMSWEDALSDVIGQIRHINAVYGMHGVGFQVSHLASIDDGTLGLLLFLFARVSVGVTRAVDLSKENMQREELSSLKGLILYGNPPASTGAKVSALEHLLESLEVFVSIDVGLNEASSYANIMLPPTFPADLHFDDLLQRLSAEEVGAESLLTAI